MKALLVAATAFLLIAATDMNTKLPEEVTKETAEKCVGQDVFDMQATNTKTAVFSLRCEDGREFLVLTHSDGTMSAIPCGQATAVCFKAYAEQGG